MQLNEVHHRYPNVVALFGSSAAFYRVLHYSIVDDRRAASSGTGTSVAYTPEHLRIIALRRLLSNALGSGRGGYGILARTVNTQLAEAMFDPRARSATIVLDGALIELAIPPAIWDEIAPVTTTTIIDIKETPTCTLAPV